MVKLPDDVAIRAESIHKDFYLPHHHENSIKRRIINVFQKKDKSVDIQHALRGISFDIKKGEFFGILGRNGSGKSTLLKIISEIYQPTKGKAAHRGKLVAFIELGVGFNPELTGRENVYLNAALLGFSRKETATMYDSIVKFAELEDFMDQKLKNYSSGMKVRLAFSVAIRANADILILDEVLAVGDAAFQKKCYDYFRTLKENKKTIVFVSHSMGQVKEYCDRAIVIEDGKTIFEGTGEEAANQYLRLFVKQREGGISQTNEHLGSQEVLINEVTASVTEKSVTIHLMTEAASSAIKGAVIGVDILADTNRLVGGLETSSFAGGRFDYQPEEKKEIIVELDNVFGSGDYLVTAAIKSPGNLEMYDFWKHAASFTNIASNDPNGYFPVLLPARISVNQHAT